MTTLPECFNEPVPESARFAELLHSRPTEVVFITRDGGDSAALREWGVLAVCRPDGGDWTPDANQPLIGRDVVLLNTKPFGWSSLIDRDRQALEFTVRRVGVLVPLGFEGDKRLQTMVEYVEFQKAAGFGPQSLVIEGKACLEDSMPEVDPPDPPETDWLPLRLREQPDVERFPDIVLPDPVADIIKTVSESIGCAPDFVGLPILVVAGAVIGRSASLELKPGYHVSTALYGMTVGNPSSGKSPAQDAITRPLWEIDHELHERYKEEKQAYEQAVAAADKKQPKSSHPEKPVLESAILEDCTVESVATHLERNPRGLLVARDEGSAWVGSLNQYKSGGRGTDRQFWLSVLFHKPQRVDRKGNVDGIPIRIPHPFLCFLGGMPPDLLSTVREPAGRVDGFLERILFVVPDPLPRRYWSDDGIPEEVRARWKRIVRRLRARPMDFIDGRFQPHVFRFSPEAKALWVEWYNSQTDRMNDPSFNPGDLAFEGKLADFAARLVLILHLLRLACDESADDSSGSRLISKWAVAGALELWKYLRSHYRRVRAHLDGAGLGTAPAGVRPILRWLENHPKVTSLSESALTRDVARLSADRALLADSLDWLAKRNAIRRAPVPEQSSGKPGRKRTPVWEVHPMLRDSEDSENSENGE